MRRIWAVLGAIGSIACMVKASNNRSILLWVLFTCWVLSPFVAAVLIARGSRALNVATAAVAIASLAIYGAVAFGILDAKVGFVFLVTPFASWLVLIGARLLR